MCRTPNSFDQDDKPWWRQLTGEPQWSRQLSNWSNAHPVLGSLLAASPWFTVAPLLAWLAYTTVRGAVLVGVGFGLLNFALKYAFLRRRRSNRVVYSD